MTAEALGPWPAGRAAATTRYLWYGHGNGVMLVHSATAPNAIMRTLPELDQQLWAPSVAAAWAATAVLTAIYAPVAPAARTALPDPPNGPQAAEETFARAVEHGDEHVIKFADTAAARVAHAGPFEHASTPRMIESTFGLRPLTAGDAMPWTCARS
jgi:hypothetical protein